MSVFNNTDLAAFKNVWVFCEQRQGKLMPTDFELISEGRRLADELGVKLCGLLLGDKVEGLAAELAGYGADEIIVCDHPLLKDYTTDAYTNEETVELLRTALQSECTPRSTRIRASALDTTHPMARAAVAGGSELFVSPTTSDMALMPFPTLKMGPGDSARSHTADEYILLSEIEAGIAGYDRFIENLAQEYGWKTLG